MFGRRVRSIHGGSGPDRTAKQVSPPASRRSDGRPADQGAGGRRGGAPRVGARGPRVRAAARRGARRGPRVPDPRAGARSGPSTRCPPSAPRAASLASEHRSERVSTRAQGTRCGAVPLARAGGRARARASRSGRTSARSPTHERGRRRDPCASRVRARPASRSRRSPSSTTRRSPRDRSSQIEPSRPARAAIVVRDLRRASHRSTSAPRISGSRVERKRSSRASTISRASSAPSEAPARRSRSRSERSSPSRSAGHPAGIGSSRDGSDATALERDAPSVAPRDDVDADREVARERSLGRRRVRRAGRHVDRSRPGRSRRRIGSRSSSARRGVDLPRLAAERLQHEHVVRVVVELEALGARRRDVRVDLARVAELDLELAAEPRDGLVVAVEALEHDRRPVPEQLEDASRVGHPRHRFRTRRARTRVGGLGDLLAGLDQAERRRSERGRRQDPVDVVERQQVGEPERVLTRVDDGAPAPRLAQEAVGVTDASGERSPRAAGPLELGDRGHDGASVPSESFESFVSESCLSVPSASC